MDKIIKQDSPENTLWKLFRLEVEKEDIPQIISNENQEFINQLSNITEEKEKQDVNRK